MKRLLPHRVGRHAQQAKETAKAKAKKGLQAQWEKILAVAEAIARPRVFTRAEYTRAAKLFMQQAEILAAAGHFNRADERWILAKLAREIRDRLYP